MTQPGRTADEEHAACLALEGRMSEALEYYDRALGSTPDNPALLNNRAVALISLCRFEDALGSARRAASLDPRSADSWINIGVALEKLDRLQEAAEALERAVAFSPYNAYARALLGIIYQKMDLPDLAENQNRRLQEIVFPREYAGLYFATAAFLLGMLSGGIGEVRGKPLEVTVGAVGIILFFFIAICGLYLRSLRTWQEINRQMNLAPRGTGKHDRRPENTYLVIGSMVGVFVLGILIGGSIWTLLH